jgi:hypothetical protein
MTGQTDRSAGESPVGLLGEVVAGFGRLVKGELALARAEAKRSLGDATSALGKLVIAAILGITALNVLAGAAIAGLIAAGLAPVWASVAVGAGLLLLAFAIVQIGLAQLKPSNLAPKRILANLRHDAETLKSMVISDATSNIRR